jgi:hypothetical protein
MKTLMASFTTWRILPIWLMLLPVIAVAKEPAKEQSALELPQCELILGKHIKNLWLFNQQGQQPMYRRRGSSMFVTPPGQYRIQEIDLQGGYSAFPRSGYSGPWADWLTLAPGKACRFDIKAPLTSSVSVKRAGRLLKLDYQLLDGDGRKYRRNDRSGKDRAHPPQFAVYQGNRQIGSGTFEYG